MQAFGKPAFRSNIVVSSSFPRNARRVRFPCRDSFSIASRGTLVQLNDKRSRDLILLTAVMTRPSVVLPFREIYLRRFCRDRSRSRDSVHHFFVVLGQENVGNSILNVFAHE